MSIENDFVPLSVRYLQINQFHFIKHRSSRCYVNEVNAIKTKFYSRLSGKKNIYSSSFITLMSIVPQYSVAMIHLASSLLRYKYQASTQQSWYFDWKMPCKLYFPSIDRRGENSSWLKIRFRNASNPTYK